MTDESSASAFPEVETHKAVALASLGWDDGHYDTQSWLRRAPWRTLKGTEYGRHAEDAKPHPALEEDPLLRKVYLIDVALFIAAERSSYKAVSGMMAFAPDELSEIQLGTQVLDECRHYEVFCHRLASMGLTVAERDRLVKRFTPPALRKFYELVMEQVDRKDFLAASLAQNVILEGMAYPVYRYEIKYWSRFDPGLSTTIAGAFADEVHHVGYGERINRVWASRATIAQRERVRRLLDQFHMLMTEAFEEIIKHYIGLYQECATQYRDLVGDIEIFKNQRLGDLSEEDQTRILLSEIQREHRERLGRIGL
jgi:hypothetical protein